MAAPPAPRRTPTGLGGSPRVPPSASPYGAPRGGPGESLPLPSRHGRTGMGAPRIGRVPTVGRGGRSVDARPSPRRPGPDPPHGQRARGRRGVRSVGPDGARALPPPGGRRRGGPDEAPRGRGSPRPRRSPGGRGGGVLLRRESRLPRLDPNRLAVLAIAAGEPGPRAGVRRLQRGGGGAGRAGRVAAPQKHVLARPGRVPGNQPGSALGRHRPLPPRLVAGADRPSRAPIPAGDGGRGHRHDR